MSRIAITGVGGIVRQYVATGHLFPGHVSADADPSLVDGVIEHAQEPPTDLTGGLFRLSDFLDRRVFSASSADKKLMVFWVKIVVGSGVAWDVAVTDGRHTGTTAEYDDPSCDASHVSGTGNKYLHVSMELASDESLRITTDAVTSDVGIIQVHFVPSKDSFTRPLN